jgi:hypothetical protein
MTNLGTVATTAILATAIATLAPAGSARADSEGALSSGQTYALGALSVDPDNPCVETQTSMVVQTIWLSRENQPPERLTFVLSFDQLVLDFCGVEGEVTELSSWRTQGGITLIPDDALVERGINHWAHLAVTIPGTLSTRDSSVEQPKPITLDVTWERTDGPSPFEPERPGMFPFRIDLGDGALCVGATSVDFAAAQATGTINGEPIPTEVGQDFMMFERTRVMSINDEDDDPFCY